MEAKTLFIGLPFLIFLSCQQPAPTAVPGKLHITCTTTMLRDLLEQIGDTLVTVEALMNPGVDPHLYKPTQGDLKKLTKAQLIFYNGLHLEGKMTEVLEKAGSQKPVFALAELLDTSLLINISGFDGQFDPHIWFDIHLWEKVAAEATNILVQYDTLHAGHFRQNYASYRDKLYHLQDTLKQMINQIPEERRVLITSHDAFGYFGRAFGMEVKGLQGISTLSEYGLYDIRTLAAFISTRRIKSVFIESSVSPAALEAVVASCAGNGQEIQLSGPLYSDALGSKGQPEGTYIGMMKANVELIVRGLK